MNIDPILFNLECVSLGFPPMFEDQSQAASMIINLESSKRREVSRKIRKIAKKEINRRASEASNPEKCDTIKSSLTRYANLGKNNNKFSKRYLVNRLRLVRSHLIFKMKSTCD